MKTLKKIISIQNLLILAVTILISTGGISCKAKKLAKEQARLEALKVEKAIKDLNALLIDEKSTPDELQAELDEIKALNLTDETVLNLIDLNQKRIDNKRAAIEEARRKKEEEEKKKVEEIKLAVDEQLDLYLQQIAKASTAAEANGIITKVLDMFASKTADVLIIIEKDGDMVDYDKPTNITEYLNYVKDSKLYNKKVEALEMDGNGKIKLLELMNR